MLRTLASCCIGLSLTACSVLPGDGGSGSRSATPRADAPQVSRSIGGGQCLAALGTTRASFEPLEDKYYGVGCSAINAVQLSAVYSDTALLGVSNLGPVTCPVASAFAAWARFGVDRAARVYLGSPLQRIETFGSYSCRNVAGTSRRSGHASATAIDVSAFVLEDGRRISVESGWSGGTAREREFLRVVHDSACKRFGTVLGPNYNAAHEDHLHIEGVVESGTSYCR